MEMIWVSNYLRVGLDWFRATCSLIVFFLGFLIIALGSWFMGIHVLLHYADQGEVDLKPWDWHATYFSLWPVALLFGFLALESRRSPCQAIALWVTIYLWPIWANGVATVLNHLSAYGVARAVYESRWYAPWMALVAALAMLINYCQRDSPPLTQVSSRLQ